MAQKIIKKPAKNKLSGEYKELIGFLGKKFEKIDQRFEKIDQRFEKIDQRFEKIDQRFEKIDQRFEKIDQRFEKIDQRFEKIDQRFEKIDQRFEKIDVELIGIQSSLDQKADRAELMEVKNEMLTHIDGLAKKIDDFQTEQAMIISQLGRHEKWHYEVAAKVGVDLLAEN